MSSAPRSTTQARFPLSAASGDVHPMYDLVRRHGRLPASEFVALVRVFRAGGGDDAISERLLASYVPLISAMVGRKSPRGSAGIQYREGATGAAIAAFFEVLCDESVELTPRVLHNAINERITRALERELLSSEHALAVSAQSAWRAGNIERTAASVSGEDVDWLTRDEVYAILGDSIRVDSIHLVQGSKYAYSLRSQTGGRGGDDCDGGTISVDTIAGSQDEATGAAALAAERISQALAALPAADARLLVDAHGLFGRRVVQASDAAAALGVHVSTYRRALNRAEALLRSALVAQAAANGSDVFHHDPAPSGRMQGAWCAADSGQMRSKYRNEVGPGMERYAERVAVAVGRFAEHEGWSATETQAAIRRVVTFRTGCSDASDHPLTARIATALEMRVAQPTDRVGSAAEQVSVCRQECGEVAATA